MQLTWFHLSVPFLDHKTGRQSVILFNTLNSSQILMDEYSFAKLQRGELQKLPEKIREFLQNNHFLTDSKPEQEIQAVIDENKAAVQYSANDSTLGRLYIAIQPTADCQLGCVYCGQSHNRNQQIDVDAVASFIEKRISAVNPTELLIGWFGGEPLLAIPKLLLLSEKLATLCGSKNIIFNYKLVTNGLNLTKQNFNHLAASGQCRSIEVTLDGLAGFHDQRRYTKYKKATFQHIYKNLLDILNSPDPRESCAPKISIRCNVDDENRNGVIPLIHQLHNDGLHKKISQFYLAPIHSWGNEAHRRLKSLEDFAKWEIDILAELVRLEFNVGLYPRRRKDLCMATSPSSLLIDPSGGIYGCSEVSLVKNYELEQRNIHQLGHIDFVEAPAMSNQNLFSGFYNAVADGKFPCRECRLLPICGGRCPKEWYEGRQACPTFKYNIRERVLLNYISSKGLIRKGETTFSMS